jgi:formylglycine-generating enzyme required for sulfatase activity
MKLALIPAGTFEMGSTDADKYARGEEKPQHEVRITRPFYLGIHEVTRGQYQAVMGQNPSHFNGSEDLPVEQVSWLDAVRFCNKLSEREGRKPCYLIEGDDVTIDGGDGYRLPTEAEWEYACRAGTTTRFSFGDDENALGLYAWYSANADSQTHPVGEKQPNAFGLYDMHGNVREWCWDGYDAAYYEQSPAVDPPGPSPAARRVVRGGGWIDDPWHSRSAFRYWNSPEVRHDDLGFRLARAQSGR